MPLLELKTRRRPSRRRQTPGSALRTRRPAARALVACAALLAASAAAAHAEEGPEEGPADGGPGPGARAEDGRAERPRTQAFLLPLDASARSAAQSVARGATSAILGSPAYEMVDLSHDLGEGGALALNPLVEGAVAEVGSGEAGGGLRGLAARFSLARVLLGSVAAEGGMVEVRLVFVDAPGARVIGSETLRLAAPGSGPDAIEARTRDAVRRLLSSPAPRAGRAAPQPNAPADVAGAPGANPEPPPDPARPARIWKRGLFDKTGTEGWDLGGSP